MTSHRPFALPLLGAAVALTLAACASVTPSPPSPRTADNRSAAAPAAAQASDVVLFALGLVETGYRFGGKNPEAGLDCSGMISYVFDKAIGLRLAGSAADIAKRGRPVDSAALRPGDLVFFNTRNKPYSHVGIYIGDGRFVHAPSSGGKVRTDHLGAGWYAARFEEARTYFD